MLPLLLLAPALAAASLLSDQLSAVQFLHEGVVFPADTFDYLPIASQYLEPENVSSYVSGWGKGGAFPYLYLHNASSPPYTCAALGPLLPGTDLPGGDLDARQLPGGSAVADCQALCCATPSCVAFTYAQSAPSAFLGCSQGAPCCYLKSTAGAPRAAANLESGSVTPGGAALAATPPHGVRSAVPLGGLGAGTIELRADGTFHECTMQNAHPAAAAKQGVLAEALLGVRVDAAGAAPVARALRTAPPPYAAGAGVASLAYAGAYPVSRLRVQDPALAPALASLQLFAYAPFKPASEPEMAHPAVAFSLLATSASAAPVNVTLYLALPWGAINDCDRVGNGSTTLSAAPQPSAAACLAACAGAPLCAAWTWAPAGTLCTLSGEPGLSRFRSGSACGVGGGWVSAGGSGGAALTFKGDAKGNAPLAPAVGDVTLMAGSDALAGAAALVGNSPDALWAAFANPGAAPGPDAFPPSATPAAAGFASLAVTITLAPGATEAVSLLWAWHFPNLDWYHQTVGNFYANLWPDSAAVAAELAAAGRLASVVGDINAHHVVMMGPPASSALPPSPIPDWLRDSLTNQFSHFRSMHWVADGRMREYEANDCPDVDSVHNDYQRHLPYLWAAPRFEISRFRKYAEGAAGDGHIQEYLGSFGLSPLDQVGGRTMADTTTLWIAELFEFYAHNGNLSFVQEMWPTAQKALAWQIRASAQIGLPWHLVSTYDILDLEQYNTTTYNSFLHLLALKAGSTLARVLGDNATATAAEDAYARAQAALPQYLWNSTYSYFRAYTGGDAVMSDALYGQEIALHHGLGWMHDQGQQSAHLAAELKYNAAAPFGLVTITGRHKPPPAAAAAAAAARAAAPGASSRAASFPAAQAAGLRSGQDSQDDVVWMQAAPTWSAMQLRLRKAAGAAFAPLSAADVASALQPAQWQLENVRSRLHDLWNVAGIYTGSDWGADAVCGMPFCTSHYGFGLVDYYLYGALTGQAQSIPNGTLSFDPVYPCPYTLPVLLMGVEGTLVCTSGGSGGGAQYTLALAFGALQLPAGGLAASGKVCAQAVSLAAGQSVTW